MLGAGARSPPDHPAARGPRRRGRIASWRSHRAVVGPTSDRPDGGPPRWGAVRHRFAPDSRSSERLRRWKTTMTAERTFVAVLSPHFDDAVLSCWHVLSAPGPVVVVNVFAGAPPSGWPLGWWDQRTGATDSAARAREREREDDAALGVAGRSPINLDLLEAQYRREPASWIWSWNASRAQSVYAMSSMRRPCSVRTSITCSCAMRRCASARRVHACVCMPTFPTACPAAGRRG